MRILGTQYTLNTKSFDIYVAGCSGNPHCVGCHNPASWDFDNGDLYTKEKFEEFKTTIVDFDKIIDNIMIFGGEPLDQKFNELNWFIEDLLTLGKDIWLFTRYDLEQVPQEIKNKCHYIKCGRYIPELKVDENKHYGINLATSNQKIYKRGVDY